MEEILYRGKVNKTQEQLISSSGWVLLRSFDRILQCILATRSWHLSETFWVIDTHRSMLRLYVKDRFDEFLAHMSFANEAVVAVSWWKFLERMDFIGCVPTFILVNCTLVLRLNDDGFVQITKTHFAFTSFQGRFANVVQSGSLFFLFVNVWSIHHLDYLIFLRVDTWVRCGLLFVADWMLCEKGGFCCLDEEDFHPFLHRISPWISITSRSVREEKAVTCRIPIAPKWDYHVREDTMRIGVLVASRNSHNTLPYLFGRIGNIIHLIVSSVSINIERCTLG